MLLLCHALAHDRIDVGVGAKSQPSLATKFIAMASDDFRAHGVIVEKYDVQRRKSDVAGRITFGYSANQVGFGWTNTAIVQVLSRIGQQRAVGQPAVGH